jgi:hypothetical protein
MKRAWLIIGSALIVLSVWCLWSFPARAITQEELSRMSRDERIKRQEERLRQIIEERRQQQEEERRRRLEETQRGAAAQSRPITRAPAPLIVLPTEVSEITLYFDPYDTLVNVGERFVTDVRITNAASKPIDIICLAIQYDPQYIQPIAVYDTYLRPLLASPPEFETDEDTGRLFYGGRLRNAQPAPSRPLVKIVWQALAETSYSSIDFLFDEHGTSLSHEGKDILGTSYDPNDGVIPASVTITKETSGLAKLPHASNYYGAPAEQIEQLKRTVRLRLSSKKKQVDIGEEFVVNVHVDNPGAILFDNVHLFIKFDPTKLEVVDWDRGNWIRRGVNINDRIAHRIYPFDYHVKNAADNQTGTIDYRMGLSENRPLPSGILAQIKFRAKAPAFLTDIAFARNEWNRPPTTDITYLGVSVLDSTHTQSKQSGQLAIEIASSQ